MAASIYKKAIILFVVFLWFCEKSEIYRINRKVILESRRSGLDEKFSAQPEGQTQGKRYTITYKFKDSPCGYVFVDFVLVSGNGNHHLHFNNMSTMVGCKLSMAGNPVEILDKLIDVSLREDFGIKVRRIPEG